MRTPLKYGFINLGGNGKGVYDYIWFKNGVKAQSEIDTVNNFFYIPVFDIDTIMLANFNGNPNAGNIDSVSGLIRNWLIYRKEKDSVTLTFVASIPVSETNITDYNVLFGQEYEYVIFAETDNEISNAITGKGTVKARWEGWSLIDLNNQQENGLYTISADDVWLFNTNFSSSDIEQNLNKYIYENFTQFPKVSTGQKNYISGGITAFLSNITRESPQYRDTAQMMQDFGNMIANGHPKLLKDRKGNAWIVDTQSNGFNYIDESYEQIITVGFNFIQIGDADSISVIKE
nr:MAG TPA: hypothetical protein [Caudoviricetes sp.]